MEIYDIAKCSSRWTKRITFPENTIVVDAGGEVR